LEVSLHEPSSREGLNIQLYPVDATFEKIERWEAVNKVNKNIPFPEADINKQNWGKVNLELRNIEEKYGARITNYIQDASLTEGESVEELVSELE